MDFTLPKEVDALRMPIADFVGDRMLPLESDPKAYDAHGNIAAGPLASLRTLSRSPSAEGRGFWSWPVESRPEP